MRWTIRQKPSIKLVAVVLAIAMSAGAGCTTAAQNPPSDDARSQARSERARWEAAKIASYSWSTRLVTSWGGDDVEVTVVDGKAVKFLDNGERASVAKDEAGGVIPLTVEELFDALDKGYADAYVTSVAYDPTFGYPTELHISPNPRPGEINAGSVHEIISDSEFEVSVTSFEPQR